VNQSPKPALCILTTASESIRFFYKGQIDALLKAGFDVTVICSYDETLPTELPSNVRYLPAEFSRLITPWKDLRALWRLVRIFRTHRFAIVQYSTPKASLLGSIASFLTGVPCRLYLLWGLYYMGQTGARRLLLKTFEKLICALSHQVLPISHEMVGFLERERITRRQKCVVILNGSACGVDLARFCPDSVKTYRKQIRERYQIPEEAVVIGTVARLTGDKGIHELLAAFEQLHRENPSVYLLLVGQQEEKDRLRPEAEELIRSHPAIRCTGWQQDPVPFYAAMDIFCLPTYREGFGEVNLEAQAMALPVVSTDVIGPRESIQSGTTGFLVPPKEVPALKEALTRLVQDASLRSRMGQAGRRRVEQMFDRKQWIEEMVRHRLACLNQINLPR